jgi:hypothetical protein
MRDHDGEGLLADSAAPSPMLRMVPLARFAGEEKRRLSVARKRAHHMLQPIS